MDEQLIYLKIPTCKLALDCNTKCVKCTVYEGIFHFRTFCSFSTKPYKYGCVLYDLKVLLYYGYLIQAPVVAQGNSTQACLVKAIRAFRRKKDNYTLHRLFRQHLLLRH